MGYVLIVGNSCIFCVTQVGVGAEVTRAIKNGNLPIQIMTDEQFHEYMKTKEVNEDGKSVQM